MYDPRFAPPPPPRPGLSPLAIALIVIGGVLVLGGGACVVIGGLVLLGASAKPDRAATDLDAGGAQVVATASPVEGSSSPPPLAPVSDDEDAPPPSVATGTAAAATSRPSTAGSWWCTASASVRVCGFAGACNYQMVFGNGTGKDRFLASQQAKSACESSARAKGATAVCIVQCSLR